VPSAHTALAAQTPPGATTGVQTLATQREPMAQASDVVQG